MSLVNLSLICIGAIEVSEMVKKGTPQKEALNSFMKRVLGSIDS